MPTLRRPLSLGGVCGAVVVLVGALIGVEELSDNSFLTHLATGHLLLDGGLGQLWGGMSDPYTFTAEGDDWVVQSWLASVLYAGADELGGTDLVRLLNAAVAAAVAGVAWSLTRPAPSLVWRIVLAGGVLVVGATWWTSRPFMFGLVFLGVAVLAAEERIDPRWLVPVGVLWVNMHGSFPLGLVALGCLALGRHLDGQAPRRELGAMAWLAGGVLAGGLVNPVGPWLLAFPVQLLGRSEQLRSIVEWQSPGFDAVWARVFLVFVVAAVLLAVRRPSYRHALPLVVFLAAALVAARNVPPAMLVLLPGAAAASGRVGTLRGEERRRWMSLAGVAVVAVGALVLVGSLGSRGTDLRGYPVNALDWMAAHELSDPDLRLAHQDYVGNLLELRHLGAVPTFIDDRYELHAPALVEDYETLLQGRPAWQEVLDRHRIDLVLWERARPLAALLIESSSWQVVYDERVDPLPAGGDPERRAEMAEHKPFVVACRTGSLRCDAL